MTAVKSGFPNVRQTTVQMTFWGHIRSLRPTLLVHACQIMTLYIKYFLKLMYET